jgi:hypothetical protein
MKIYNFEAFVSVSVLLIPTVLPLLLHSIYEKLQPPSPELFIKEFNPLNPKLNPICYLLALLAHHFLHVSRIRVKSLTLRLVISYIYGTPILDVSTSHTTTQHGR